MSENNYPGYRAPTVITPNRETVTHSRHPYLRLGEGKENDSNWTYGLKLIVEGKRYFFPGFTPNAAGLLAEMALGRDVIEADATYIEYGKRTNDQWECIKVMKKVHVPEE